MGFGIRGFNASWLGKRFSCDKQGTADKLRPSRANGGLPEKTLVLIPFRFATEMVRRGLILRNTLIWHKPNCLPASVKDRFTIDFEYLLFFAKAKRYFFQLQFEPHHESTKRRVRSFHENNEHFDPTRHKHAPGDVSDAPFAILKRMNALYWPNQKPIWLMGKWTMNCKADDSRACPGLDPVDN